MTLGGRKRAAIEKKNFVSETSFEVSNRIKTVVIILKKEK